MAQKLFIYFEPNRPSSSDVIGRLPEKLLDTSPDSMSMNRAFRLMDFSSRVKVHVRM